MHVLYQHVPHCVALHQNQSINQSSKSINQSKCATLVGVPARLQAVQRAVARRQHRLHLVRQQRLGQLLFCVQGKWKRREAGAVVTDK